jgi:hypothetical protein
LLSAVLALVAVAGGLLTSRPDLGLGGAVGLLAGGVNGRLARRALELRAPFQATSLARLALATAAAISVGIILGVAGVVAALIGVAFAQLLLATVSFREALR